MGYPPSTIWATLAGVNSPVGSIPFVAIDGSTPQTDALNFFYSQAGLSAYATGLQPLQLTVFGGLRVGYTDTQATPGAVTINKTAGRIKMAAGQNSIVVQSTYCFAASLVNVTIEGAGFDATATRNQVVPANGSFTIFFNANATGAIVMSFDIKNVY